MRDAHNCQRIGSPNPCANLLLQKLLQSQLCEEEGWKGVLLMPLMPLTANPPPPPKSAAELG